jgi:hypothetical protein
MANESVSLPSGRRGGPTAAVVSAKGTPALFGAVAEPENEHWNQHGHDQKHDSRFSEAETRRLLSNATEQLINLDAATATKAAVTELLEQAAMTIEQQQEDLLKALNPFKGFRNGDLVGSVIEEDVGFQNASSGGSPRRTRTSTLTLIQERTTRREASISNRGRSII